MKQYGVPYKITSTVTEVEDGKVVEWQHPLGHKWRWELAEATPGDDTVTEVTETFDYSTAKMPLMITAFGYDKKNGDGITVDAAAARRPVRRLDGEGGAERFERIHVVARRRSPPGRRCRDNPCRCNAFAMAG